MTPDHGITHTHRLRSTTTFPEALLEKPYASADLARDVARILEQN